MCIDTLSVYKVNFGVKCKKVVSMFRKQKYRSKGNYCTWEDISASFQSYVWYKNILGKSINTKKLLPKKISGVNQSKDWVKDSEFIKDRRIEG